MANHGWKGLFLLGGMVGLLALSSCGQDSSTENDAGKIQAALIPAKDQLPDSLSGTNLFKNGDIELPAADLAPYRVKVPLWSDGAQKSRYVFVPPQAKITYHPLERKFQFPVGTTFVKHFSTPTQQPIETRVITQKDDGQWYFVTYVWNEDGTTEKSERPHRVTVAGLEYRIPSQLECKMCHQPERPILGFNLKQVNFSPDQKINQLERLARGGLFENQLEELVKVRSHEDPGDAALPINVRARTYLTVNCSPCHNPGGVAKEQGFDARWEAIDTKLEGAGKIVPGNVDESILWQKISAETDRMPPVSLRADPQALDVLKQFILEWPK